MLMSLAIKDLAIIDHATLEFGPGLNVITGETGAGKSIIVGALTLLLGDRARTDTIRRGASRAEISALFHVDPEGPAAAALRELDLLDPEADGSEPLEVVVRRVVATGGKGRVHVNGQLVTVGTLAEIMRHLVDISSQHQHTRLLDPSTHLDVLDRFGGLRDLRAAYEAAWHGLVAARQRRDGLRTQETERLAREDFVRFQLDEIDAVKPRAGEDDELDAEARRLSHAETLMGGAIQVSEALGRGTRSVGDQLRDVEKSLEKLARLDSALEPLRGRVEAVRIELEDVAMEVSSYGHGVDIDPRRLQSVNERLDALNRIGRKHGGSLEAVLLATAALRAELARFESLEEAVTEAEAEVARLQVRAEEAATTLSSARSKAGASLSQRIVTELHSLAMAGADLRFSLTPLAELGPRGKDAGEILIQTNVGEGIGPLARVASGGELSRVLLALKRALVRADAVETCIFDEVDAGTGGAVGDTIGQKLKEIGVERQVITITHLAPIAARAALHLRVEKGVDGERTVTRVVPLDDAARTDEIARMLGGLAITPSIRATAAELLRLRAV